MIVFTTSCAPVTAFKIARDGAPDGASRRPGQQRQRQVDEPWQACNAVADKCRTQCPNAELPFCADIEQAAFESHRHCQAGQDVGRDRGQALREWVDGQQESLLVSCGNV